ncbi:MAG: hypothetical protein ABR584_11125 [Candidatus Baltobacteraceae bacterium]
MDPNSKETSAPASLGVLVDRAIEITARHFQLFAVVTMLTIALQAIVYFAVRGITGANLAGLLLPPIITTIANIRCALDLREAELPMREILAWAFGRVWAVILIDFIFSYAFADGTFGMLSGDASGTFMGVLTVLLTSTLIFADVYASIEAQRNAFLQIPLAFMRSITLAWQNGNMLRIVLLAVFQITLVLVAIMLQQWLDFKHVRGAIFFASVPLQTLFVAPLSVLTTVVYFDCLARERETIS